MGFIKEFLNHSFFFVIISSTVVAVSNPEFANTGYRDVLVGCVTALAGLHVPVDRNKDGVPDFVQKKPTVL